MVGAAGAATARFANGRQQDGGTGGGADQIFAVLAVEGNLLTIAGRQLDVMAHGCSVMKAGRKPLGFLVSC
jgi:hypothetical protein